MNKLFLGLAAVIAGCGEGVAQSGDLARPAQFSPQTIVGAVHAGASPAQPRALLAGALAAHGLGARTLRLQLGPAYQAQYPERWPEAHSLAELAATPAFEEVFALPFDTFVLTASTFSAGDRWIESDEAVWYQSEREELAELARHLLTRWAGSGKRFVLQSSAGDSATRAGAQRMTRWLRMRQAAVASARAVLGDTGVEVVHAAELDSVLSPSGKARLLTEVLPHLEVDALSWAAWEALDRPAVDSVQEKLSRGLAAIRAAAPRTPVFVGAFGFAEAELPAELVEPLVLAVLERCREEQVPQVLYSQVYDAECPVVSPPAEGGAAFRGKGLEAGCRGRGLVGPDGSPGLAARAVTAFTSSTPNP